MRNEKDLSMKYVVLKIDDINKLDEYDKNTFWTLFWRMIDKKD